MKIIHRISLRASKDRRRKLENLGVELPTALDLPGGGDPFFAFDVDEDHPNWPKLMEQFSTWEVGDITKTEFTLAEVAAADWLEIQTNWLHGYPEPIAKRGFLEATYDLDNYCRKCGIGLVQRAPFRLKGEPKWGKKNIFILNWVYDQLFVTPDVWERVFRPHKIGFMPVTNKKGVELGNVVQLDIQGQASIDVSGLPAEDCSSCGRRKYLPISRGPFPALKGKPTLPIAKTKEDFGSGASAEKAIVISKELARDIHVGGVRGAHLTPTFPVR